MDLYFYQECSVIKKLRYSDDDNNLVKCYESVIGGVAEFKNDDGEITLHSDVC